MHAIPLTTPSRDSRHAATDTIQLKARDLYEFRRVNYAAGWDDDDAALGWVDADLVDHHPRRRTH